MNENLTMPPWTFLVAALAIPDVSTGTRVSLLEVGFWNVGPSRSFCLWEMLILFVRRAAVCRCSLVWR
jgi:hypothetical protein